MKNYLWRSFMVAALICAFLPSVPAFASQEYVLKLSDTQPDGSSLLIHLRMFVELIEKKSNGRIKHEVFPSAMMGPSPAVVQQVQMGALDLFRTDVSVLYDFGVPSMQMMGLPFLFDSKEQAQRVLYGPVGDRFLKDVDDANINLKAIGWLIEPSRNLFLRNKRVASLDDVRGLKIRVPESEIFLATMAAFGISGTPIPWGEVYTSLQTGVVDGAENTLNTFNINRFDEVCRYIAMSQHNFNTCVMVMSKRNWDRMSPADQALIVECWKEAMAAYDAFAMKDDVESKELASSRGVEIVEMTDRQKWVDAVKPLFDKYAADYQDVVAAIRATK
ncbi:MAG: TRAP transporter substrate-binding protein [Planctomycetes bacterium]|nr:TRAP transporter substrate-binding protein [Planctomycetota bacterium]